MRKAKRKQQCIFVPSGQATCIQRCIGAFFVLSVLKLVVFHHGLREMFQGDSISRRPSPSQWRTSIRDFHLGSRGASLLRSPGYPGYPCCLETWTLFSYCIDENAASRFLGFLSGKKYGGAGGRNGTTLGISLSRLKSCQRMSTTSQHGVARKHSAVSEFVHNGQHCAAGSWIIIMSHDSMSMMSMQSICGHMLNQIVGSRRVSASSFSDARLIYTAFLDPLVVGRAAVLKPVANFQAFQALTPTMVVLSAAIIKKDKTLVARSQRPVWPKLSSWCVCYCFL